METSRIFVIDIKMFWNTNIYFRKLAIFVIFCIKEENKYFSIFIPYFLVRYAKYLKSSILIKFSIIKIVI